MLKQVDNLVSLRQELSQTTNIIVEFSAEWCGPCRAMAPIVEEVVRTNPSINLVTVDIEGEGIEEVLREYHVVAVPTFVKVRNGEKVSSVAGSQPKAKLLEFLLG